MKSKTKKIIAGSALAAVGLAGAAAVSHSITDYLMRVALDRNAPKSLVKNQEKMMGNEANRELIAMLKNASEQLEAKVTEEAEITAHDGTKLVGHWWPCENPKRVVIAMHGWRSTWSLDFGIKSGRTLWKIISTSPIVESGERRQMISADGKSKPVRIPTPPRKH